MCLDEPNDLAHQDTRNTKLVELVCILNVTVYHVCVQVYVQCVYVCTYSVHVFLHISYGVIAGPAPGTGILVTS